MRVVAQLAEFWKNFGPDKHAACGQRPAWHDSVLSRALAKFTGSLSMVTTRHPGSHSSTLPVRDVTSRRGSRSTVLFQSFPPRFSASGEGKRENYRTNIWLIILSFSGSCLVTSLINFSSNRGVHGCDAISFLLEFASKSRLRKFLQSVLLTYM